MLISCSCSDLEANCTLKTTFFDYVYLVDFLLMFGLGGWLCLELELSIVGQFYFGRLEEILYCDAIVQSSKKMN
jgi:hypothetical protein